MMKMVHLFGTNARAECVGSLTGIELMMGQRGQRVGMALDFWAAVIYLYVCTNLNECCSCENAGGIEFIKVACLQCSQSAVPYPSNPSDTVHRPTGRSCKQSSCVG